MGISDLISFIGIILAILAFLDNSDRTFIKNKFTSINFFSLIVIFIFLNFLLFYKSWRKYLPFLQELEKENYPLSSTWAYVISIFTLIWILCKIFVFEFPKSNHNKLILYFQNLKLKKDYSRISFLINQFKFNQHSNTFQKFLFNHIISDNNFIESTIDINETLFKQEANKNTLFFNKYLNSTIKTNKLSLDVDEYFISNFKKINFTELLTSLNMNINLCLIEKNIFLQKLSIKMINNSEQYDYFILSNEFQKNVIKSKNILLNIDKVFSSNLELIEVSKSKKIHFSKTLNLSILFIIETFKINNLNYKKYILEFLTKLESEIDEKNIKIISDSFSEALKGVENDFQIELCSLYDLNFKNTKSLFKIKIINELKNY